MANPNPSPETRFGGPRGNTPVRGKTKKQKKAEMKAAENAALLRARMLSIIAETTKDNDAALMEYLKGDVLKLFKDSEDRAHGTPKQSIDHTTAGEPIGEIRNTIVRPDGKKD